jgi:hypothetical protein
MSSSSTTEIVRRGLLKISSDKVFEVVDSLDLRPGARISAVVGIPLRNLQQKRDLEAFCANAPIAAVRGLLELLSMEPLQNIIEELGDHADTPTFEQLSAGVDAIVANGATVDDVVALLAFAVAEEFPAAPHCRKLLEERADYALPELSAAVSAPAPLAPKQVDPSIKEQRKARREAEKAKKKPKTAAPVPYKAAEKVVTPKTVEKKVVTEVVPEITRRQLFLTPLELEKFDPAHLLAGTVVMVDVPFDAVDPENPEQKSKERPALIVAASENALLVRGIYSKDSPSRQLFQPWRRLGLSNVCYLSDDRIAIDYAPGSLAKIGVLTDAEWNALF